MAFNSDLYLIFIGLKVQKKAFLILDEVFWPKLPKKQLKVQYIVICEEIDSFYWPKMHFLKKGQKIRAWVDPPPPSFGQCPKEKFFFSIDVFPYGGLYVQWERGGWSPIYHKILKKPRTFLVLNEFLQISWMQLSCRWQFHNLFQNQDKQVNLGLGIVLGTFKGGNNLFI